MRVAIDEADDRLEDLVALARAGNEVVVTSDGADPARLEGFPEEGQTTPPIEQRCPRV